MTLNINYFVEETARKNKKIELLKKERDRLRRFAIDVYKSQQVLLDYGWDEKDFDFIEDFLPEDDF